MCVKANYKKHKMKKNKRIQLLFIVLPFLVMNSSCQSQTDKTSNKTSTTIQTKSKDMKTTKEIIVDVRSTEEWEMDGHADCSVNYPLDQIQDKIEELKKYEHIVLVCRSGNRAGIAQRVLEGAGIKNVENLGPWQNVSCAN
jgi:phage shock protein E